MADLFTWSAWIGGTILVGQTLLILLGAGHGDVDSDVHFDGDGHFDLEHSDAAQHHFLGALSLRAIVAFATFFGLIGLAGRSAGMDTGIVLLLAAGAGVLAMFLIAQAMRWLARLQSSGTIDLRNAQGCRARVYLGIPAHGAGQGRVHVDVQGRRIELRAISKGEAIATGEEVKVVDIAPDGCLVVEPNP